MTIPNFSTTFKEDIKFLEDYYFVEKEEESKVPQKKIDNASTRMFSVFGMALSVNIALKAFTAATAIGALSNVACAASLYAVNHDVFIMARNADKGILEQSAAIANGIFSDFKDLCTGKKKFGDVQRQPLTEGTILRPLWDKVLSS